MIACDEVQCEREWVCVVFIYVIFFSSWNCFSDASFDSSILLVLV